MSAPAAAQGSYSPYNEGPAAALARYVHILADDPKNFDSLIGAGRAALALGDTQAAAGFFARADEVNPRSPLPQAGMGAVAVANGYPQAGLPYFKRAQQLGATPAMIACDRGLAYDLLGKQADAQSDYRAALSGADADEARRRLALSLAISGDKAGALAALSPLLAQRDAAAARTRAFVLALTGDSNGAMVAADAAMPGSWARVAPFLQRLSSLQPAQKAAAVNLGIFPDSGNTAFAYAAPTRSDATQTRNDSASATFVTSVTTDRLAAIDDLLRQPAQAAAQPTQQPAPSAPAQPSWQPVQQPSWQARPQATQLAYNAPVTRQQLPAQSSLQFAPRKIWLQLASGSNAAALPSQFERIRSRDRDLFDGITGYVAKSPDRARLVIGPFRSAGDADIFAADLETMNVNAFKWSNSPSDQIVPLGME